MCFLLHNPSWPAEPSFVHSKQPAWKPSQRSAPFYSSLLFSSAAAGCRERGGARGTADPAVSPDHQRNSAGLARGRPDTRSAARPRQVKVCCGEITDSCRKPPGPHYTLAKQGRKIIMKSRADLVRLFNRLILLYKCRSF